MFYLFNLKSISRRSLFTRLVLVGCVILLLVSFPAVSGPGIWTSNGPDGGRVRGLVASPNTINTYYASTRGGVFKSVDGGVTWADRSAGINRALSGVILHSQTAPDRLYAAGFSNLYFSNDAALSWQDRSPPAALIMDTTIFSATLSPVFPGRIYLGLNNGVVLRSDDAGISWAAVTPVPHPDDFFRVVTLTAHPTQPDVLLVATNGTESHRLYRGTAAGDTWVEIACPAGTCLWENQPLLDIKFSGNAGKVWAVSRNGVTRSTDFGTSWTPIGTFATDGGESLGVNPADSNDLFIGGRVGLSFTEDDGASWTEVLSGFIGNSSSQPAESTEVVYDPFNPGIQLAGSMENGVYRRTSPAAVSWVPGVNNFNATNIRAIDTTIGDRVHAASSDAFGAAFNNFRSTNNGLSWDQTNSSLAADEFRDVVVDPNNPMVVYAGGSYRAKQNDAGMSEPGNGGIYKSVDNGDSWSTIDAGIPLSGMPGDTFRNSLLGTVRSISVDVFSAMGGDSQILYAGGTGRFSEVPDGMGGTMIVKQAARIYKSSDAGANWVAMDNGIGMTEPPMDGGQPLFASVVQIVQDHSDASGNSLYAATFIGGLDGTDEPTMLSNGVFRTVDGGANWVEMSNGLPTINNNPAAAPSNVLSLAIDPTDASGQTLYASSNNLDNVIVDIGSVYKTVDGGANWTFSGIGLENRDVRDLTVDPVTGDVYAAAADARSNGDGGVFVSVDGGASWSSISVGFPSAAVALKLALDNTGGNLLIQAGTTRGVQSFEALPDMEFDGAPNIVEDDSPNAGDGNLDGMPDSMQSNVASPEINDNIRGTQSFITATLTPIQGNCNNLENSFGLDLLSSVPIEASYDLPFNGLHLRIPDCQQAELELIYHTADFSGGTYQIRAYGLDFTRPELGINSWQRIPASNTGNSWTFQLTDGQPGDTTPADNVIVFQGGAKVLREVFFVDGLEVE